MKRIIFLFTITLSLLKGFSQNVGIGTTTPDNNALLHIDVSTSSTKGFLVTGSYIGSSSVPDLGAGNRMMFYPGKAAFRAGYVSGTNWNNSFVGYYSMAMGYNTTASGSASFAMGDNAKATGQNSIALGYNNISSNNSTTSIGFNTKASGIYSTALGNSTTATGASSVSLGFNTTASGHYSTALGNYTISSGNYSLATGLYNKAKGFSSTVVGMYNDSILTEDQTNFFTPYTPLFIIGNGNDESTRSNAMTVEKNGNVAIGKITPHNNALLHVDVGTSTNKGLLITGTYDATSSVPDLGAGSRMMFYPGKAAFRVGYAGATHWNNVNVGLSSTAMGYSTIASDFSSTAMGYSTIASGSYSTAMGTSTIASGDISMTMGSSTIASGFNSTTMGFATRATHNYSTALGVFTTASGHNALAMGYSTIAKGRNSTVLGMYNDSILLADQDGSDMDPTTPLFIIGNGSDIFNRSNAMVVRKNGNVGIGTNAPTARLHLKSNSLGNATNSQLLLEEDGDDYTRLTMKNTATPSRYWDMGAYSHTTNSSARLTFYYQGVGDILSLKGDGNATLIGTLTQASDSRLKKNIVAIENALEKLTGLNGYNYYWSDENKDQSLQTGVLAQEVEKVFPELVKSDEKGMLSVNYSGIIPVLIQSIKEQQKQIDDLKKEVHQLQKK